MTGDSNLNSIDLALKVFREVIFPLSEKDESGKLEFKASRRNKSYFKTPRRPRLSRKQMEEIATLGVFSCLEELWRKQQLDVLLKVIPHIKAIRAQVSVEQESGKTDPDSPSHLIYQMH